MVQFHHLSAAASRAELVRWGEVKSAEWKRDAQITAATAATAAAPPTLCPHVRRHAHAPLGAFAAVCTGGERVC